MSQRILLQVYRAVLDANLHVAVKKLNNSADIPASQLEAFAKEVRSAMQLQQIGMVPSSDPAVRMCGSRSCMHAGIPASSSCWAQILARCALMLAWLTIAEA